MPRVIDIDVDHLTGSVQIQLRDSAAPVQGTEPLDWYADLADSIANAFVDDDETDWDVRRNGAAYEASDS